MVGRQYFVSSSDLLPNYENFGFEEGGTLTSTMGPETQENGHTHYSNGFSPTPGSWRNGARPSSSLYLPKKHRRKKKCCGDFTKLELFLIFASLFLLTGLLGTLSCWFVMTKGFRLFQTKVPNEIPITTTPLDLYPVTGEQQPNDSTVTSDPSAGIEPVCSNRECAKIAGLFAQNMNPDVDPCDDFYEFACGNYELWKNLPSNHEMRTTIMDAAEILQKRLKNLLKEKIEINDPKWKVLVKSYYHKCIDTEKTEETGAKDFQNLFSKLGGWPILEGDKWDPPETNYTWEKAVGRFYVKTGLDGTLIEFDVTFDQKNSSVYKIELDQPGFGMGSRSYYLEEGTHPQVRNYTQLIIDVAKHFGANETIAAIDADAIVDLEIRLAGRASDEEDRKDKDQLYNPRTPQELEKVYKGINFMDFLSAVFPASANVNENETIIIKELSFFHGLSEIMETVPITTVQNYLIWRLIHRYQKFLPQMYRAAFVEFEANRTGSNVKHERWTECVKLATRLLPLPVGALYVEKHYDGSKKKAKMSLLAKYLKESFIRELKDLDWMDEATKTRALEKAYKLDYKTGYPEHILDQEWMETQWDKVRFFEEDNLLDATVKLRQKITNETINKLRQPADKTLWFQSPAIVDAYYAPNVHQMVFPAGIMQFPFLQTEVPNYITFAMAGAIVGHEISHAFDNQGRQFDEDGNLNDWWDKDTDLKFQTKSQCLIEQYGSIEVRDAGGIKLNGQASLGENIADNAGVKSAFLAYKLWEELQNFPELSLPGFTNFTNEQMFFIAYANNWCSVIRPAMYRHLILADEHSPAKYRAIVPLKNFHKFSEAFNCDLGSSMNPDTKCKLW